jgi:hypothetical protein
MILENIYAHENDVGSPGKLTLLLAVILQIKKEAQSSRQHVEETIE